MADTEADELQLANIADELEESEAAYVADLNTMLKVYLRPARKMGLLSPEEMGKIFANVEELVGCNEAFLALLQKEKQRRSRVEAVATAVLDVAPFFKLYATYAKNYKSALETTRECRMSNTGFQELLKSVHQRKETKNLTLEAFLIKPVQRLLKYPLFLRELLKLLPEAHTSRQRLQDADAVMLSVSKAVDESMSTNRLHVVLQGLGPEYLQLLVAPSRHLLYEFRCHFVTENKSFSAVGYLTNDIMLVCRADERRTGGASSLIGRYTQTEERRTMSTDDRRTTSSANDDDTLLRPFILCHLNQLTVYSADATVEIRAAPTTPWPLCLRLAGSEQHKAEVFRMELSAEDERTHFKQLFDRAASELEKLLVRYSRRETPIQLLEPEVLLLCDRLYEDRHDHTLKTNMDAAINRIGGGFRGRVTRVMGLVRHSERDVAATKLQSALRGQIARKASAEIIANLNANL